jgi:hypothetical protein
MRPDPGGTQRPGSDQSMGARWEDGEMTDATVIIADVVRRLLRYQIHDYSRAKSILDVSSLSEMAQKIVEEEPGVVTALYACVYDRNGELRRDDQGLPLSRDFIESKVLNLKANPYRESTALLLRGIFMDLRDKMGNDYRKTCRQLFHQLHALKEHGDEEAEAA